MKQKRGEGGKLGQGVGALKRLGWNPLTNYVYTQSSSFVPRRFRIYCSHSSSGAHLDSLTISANLTVNSESFLRMSYLL